MLTIYLLVPKLIYLRLHVGYLNQWFSRNWRRTFSIVSLIFYAADSPTRFLLTRKLAFRVTAILLTLLIGVRKMNVIIRRAPLSFLDGCPPGWLWYPDCSPVLCIIWPACLPRPIIQDPFLVWEKNHLFMIAVESRVEQRDINQKNKPKERKKEKRLWIIPGTKLEISRSILSCTVRGSFLVVLNTRFRGEQFRFEL